MKITLKFIGVLLLLLYFTGCQSSSTDSTEITSLTLADEISVLKKEY